MTATALKNGWIKIHNSCRDNIREFGLYSWDDKSEQDKVLKTNDHSMDDTRYFVYTILRREPKFRAFLEQSGIDPGGKSDEED